MQQMGKKSTKPPIDISTTNANHSNNTNKADRKTVERNRRNHMKTLYSELNSLIPHHNHQGSTSSCREATPLMGQIDEAIGYIKNLQEKLEESRRKRDDLQRWTSSAAGAGRSSNKRSSSNCKSCSTAYKSPKIEVQERDYAIEVILITGLECQFIFNEAIRILHEEATEVVNATFNVVQDTVYHTIHAKTGDLAPSCKFARITERLKQFDIDQA